MSPRRLADFFPVRDPWLCWAGESAGPAERWRVGAELVDLCSCETSLWQLGRCDFGSVGEPGRSLWGRRGWQGEMLQSDDLEGNQRKG